MTDTADDLTARLRAPMTVADGIDYNRALKDEAADRIDELEQWKAEGLAVLDEWEQVYDMVPHPTGTLGLTKASVVGARITEMQAAMADQYMLGYKTAGGSVSRILRDRIAELEAHIDALRYREEQSWTGR